MRMYQLHPRQTARFESWVDAYFDNAFRMKHFEYQRGVGIPPYETTGIARQFRKMSLERVERSDLSAQREAQAVKIEILRAPLLRY